MTTRPPVMPRPTAKTQYTPNNDYYPDESTGMRKYGKPAVPRIQTMPPTSEEIGIYSYLDQEDMDDGYITKTLEAIESGEFFDVPDEIMTWYNSIAQDDGVWSGDKNEMKQQMFGITPSSYEYIDVNNDRTVPSKDYEEVSISFKQNKRFLKGEKMNFLKDRLNQFITSNFAGMKKRQVTKRPQAVSISEPIDKFCGGVLVTSNSFDNSVSSLEYIEHPKRRPSTELLISQMPQAPAPAKDDNWYFYLDNSKSFKKHNNLTRQTSKSLENVFTPTQSPTPTPPPLSKTVLVEEDPYLVPLRICKPAPIPPPRVSSRVMDPTMRGRGYDDNLTQDYVEPNLLAKQSMAKNSTPIRESPKVKPPHHRNLSTGSRPTEYILPEDEPLTPMTRFNTDSSVNSIPVLSPDEDYNDPRDFNLKEIRQEPVKYKSRQQPEVFKPHVQQKPPLSPKPLMNGHIARKPTPPPKPKIQAPKKPNKPRFLAQNSAPRPADSHGRTVVNGSYRV